MVNGTASIVLVPLRNGTGVAIIVKLHANLCWCLGMQLAVMADELYYFQWGGQPILHLLADATWDNYGIRIDTYDENKECQVKKQDTQTTLSSFRRFHKEYTTAFGSWLFTGQ
jgi:hypothetical protein